jgi:hypothetical protein
MEGSAIVQTIQEEIAEHRAELDRIRELMDVAFSRGAKSTNSPEDRVIFPLLVSCRDLTEEILFAIKDGFGRAALRATRTMYECVVVARHLHLHPEKVDDFLNMFHIEWAKILQDIPEQSRPSQMDSQVASKVSKYAVGKRVGMGDLNWSGSSIYEMAKEAGTLVALHSPSYSLVSAYVHPSAMFLISTLTADSSDQTKLKLGERTQDQEARYALRNAHDLLINAADLRRKYAQTPELTAALGECVEDFRRIWGYSPHT